MPTPAPSNEGCFKNEVLLDFHTANLTVNNLGGRGPNTGKAEEMRFSRVGQIDSEDLDLVITAYNSSQYYGVATSNGKSGEFGQINQAVGKSSEFQFKFEYTSDWKAAQASGSTSSIPAVSLPVFTFTVFDLDKSTRGDTESMCIDDPYYYPTIGSDLVLSEDTTRKCDGSVGSSMTITANQVGFSCDNPEDPLSLGLITEDDCRRRLSKADYLPINLVPTPGINNTTGP